MATGAGVMVDIDQARERLRQIAEIDSTLDAASGSVSAGKTAQRNRIVNAAGDAHEDVVNEIVDYVSQYEGEELVAAYFSLVKTLESKFDDEVDEILENVVEESQKDAVEVSDEELAELETQRKTLVDEFEAMANFLTMFGQSDEVEKLGKPKRRTGARGKRKPRTLAQYRYTVNETELPPGANLGQVAKFIVDDEGNSMKVNGEDGLKAYLKAHAEPKPEGSEEFDLKNPPAEWSSDLPKGIGTLHAVKLEQFREEESADDETGDE